MTMPPDVVIIGAGVTGCVLAQQIASHSGASILLIEKSRTLGGLCSDYQDSATGVRIPRFGNHVVYTNSDRIWSYLNQWVPILSCPFEVLAAIGGDYLPLPINLETIRKVYNANFSATEARAALVADGASIASEGARSLEEQCINCLGRRLYSVLVEPYCVKHYGVHPRNLLPGRTAARLQPQMDTSRGFYRKFKWHGFPKGGYGALFSSMVHNSSQIHCEYDTDYLLCRSKMKASVISIYTGPIDAYFNYTYGALQTRSLAFTVERVSPTLLPEAETITYPESGITQSRVHRPLRLQGQSVHDNSREPVVVERACTSDNGQLAKFPLDTHPNRLLRRRYRELACREASVVFCGRLAATPYASIADSVAAALKTFSAAVVPILLARGRMKPKDTN